ncbi:MAG: LuxR family transcriptional regulator [Bacteroidales bacterium]|nr:MAG: LuxR family transcriptional regulator [Bacteroidales bacterium]
MDTFKIILLIIAYTIGIFTFSLQLICYLKDIEYKETLLLNLSFLLLIAASTVSEFFILTNYHIKLITEFSSLLFMILLAFAIPLNIHKERIVKYEKTRNRILLLITITLILVLVFGYFTGLAKIAKEATEVFLFLSVMYTMYIVIKEKPSLLIKHREKEEKVTALFFLIFFPIYTLIGLLNYRYAFVSDSMFDGPIILSLIFIALAISKLTDDIKRLTLFSPKNKDFGDKLSPFNISPREIEVLGLLIQGISYKEISEKLFISLPTVKTHVSNIYQKMNVKNKVELINLLNA